MSTGVSFVADEGHVGIGTGADGDGDAELGTEAIEIGALGMLKGEKVLEDRER